MSANREAITARTQSPTWTDAVVDWRGRTIEAPEVIGQVWSDEGADYQAYLHSRRPAPPPQPDPDDEPDPPTTPAPAKPRMFNGYEHPGPAPRELVLDAGGEDSFVKRAEREARERYEALECKCVVCILNGPAYCPGDSEPLRPMTTEQARVARELIVHEGQRQAEQRKRREQLIAAQVEKAKAAGHDAKRIEKAVTLAGDSEALEAAATKYNCTPAGCQCPDARHSSAPKCKHQLAAIITANVSRAMNGAEVETATPPAKAEPAGCPTCGYPTSEAICPVCAMVIDPLSEDVPLEVLDPAADPSPYLNRSPLERMKERQRIETAEAAARIPVHTPAPARDAAGMIWS